MGLITTILEAEIKWFTAHKGFLNIALIAGAVLWGHHEYRNYLANKDARQDSKANIVLQSQVDANRLLAEHSQADAESYKQLVAQLIPQIQQLQVAIQTRNTTAETRQKTDATLPPDQLASRIVALAPGGTVMVHPDSTYQLDQPEAVAVTQKLELVEPLQSDLVDEQKISADKDQQLDKVNTYVSSLNEQVNGLTKQIVDKDAACKADVKIAVDKEKKKHKWYMFGAIIIIEAARIALTGKG